MAEPKKFSELGVTLKPNKLVGEKRALRHVLDVDITVHDFRIKPAKYTNKSDKCLYLQYSIDGKMYVAFSIAKFLMETLQALPADSLPFTTKITNKNEIYEFE
jgi:hypothetical protein